MDAPSDAPTIDTFNTDELQRPIGVAVLSALSVIYGLVLLGAFVILLSNWQENNEWAINRRLAPSLLWTFTSLSIALAFAASIGMWRGRKWGWWLACSGFVFFVIQNFTSAIAANLSNGAPSIDTYLSVDSLKFAVRGLISVGILTYWLRTCVRRYFRVERVGRIKAVVLAAVCSIGTTTIITVVLQSVFLFRTR